MAVVTLFGFLIHRDRENLLHQTVGRSQEQALLLADHAARLFEGAELALSTVIDETKDLPWDQIDNAFPLHMRMRRLAERLPYVEAFWLNDGDGRLRLTSLTFPAPPQDISDRDHFLVHRQGAQAQVFVSHLVTGQRERPTFRLSRRLENKDGGFRGVASLTVEVAFFRNFYGTLSLPLGSSVMLLRQDDLSPLVQQPATPGTDVAQLHDFGRLRAAIDKEPVSGDFRGLSPLDGIERVYSYRAVPGFPLFVKVSVPVETVRSQWLELARIRLATASAVVALLGLLSWLALRQAHRQRAFQEELERQVSQRTGELARANAVLEDLLQEVHHRVRNNLQIVGSLLGLQAARERLPQVREALSQAMGRVHTMSLVHQQLYASPEAMDLPIGDYLRLLVDHMEDIYGPARVAVSVEGANPRLPVDIAIPVALIVHEVMSNILRHAFPLGREGHIGIVLITEDSRLRLLVVDDGIGLPPDFDWSAEAGLGLSIVHSMTELIGAVTTVASEGEGTRFSLCLPLPAASCRPPSQ